ncbi:unnamed protein product [Rotaria magnacalcarata]|uniref:C2H2-type domain-containing protein n=1 Tax=Rotaria magnacalcarata TaxID=392030 RepID=A0A816TA00_9BILA|nr:unnamed protein product [Rotaria magnacalcarata]CAF3734322.1 unnamed protein product [Rotaria magnacalcarata]
MILNRIRNSSTSGRKPQTAVKQTIDRPKTKTWYNDNSISHRNHSYSSQSVTNNNQFINDDNSWLKSSTTLFDDTPELELTCEEEMLGESQLQSYPTQAYDPTAPLPLPAVRKRTSVLKKSTTQDIEILQDPDEDFIPSESDDDDDENYLPEHDRRPYNRTSHVNGSVGRGRGRGGRGHHLTSTNSRLPPSTHFVRPQPDINSHARSKLHSSSFTDNHRHHDRDSFDIELERSYASALLRYYGTRNGQTINSSDYGDYRIKCSICGEQSLNNMSFIAHLCSHFEDDLNYISPFDKIYRRCSVCHDEFSTPFQTLLHKDQEHMIEINEFRCRICQQNHHSLIDLFTHLNYTHIGLDMPYICDRCNYRTSMYEDMAYHIRQLHKGTQYFFCPYCFQSVLLPTISNTNILNSTPAFRHVILHFDRIENSNNKQQRRIESLFKFCNRCTLHVKSLKEHYNYHHLLNINNDEKKSYSTYEENNLLELKRNSYQQMNDSYNHRFYPLKFDRTKQLPMATIRRRQTASNNYEQVHMNNRWYSRR